MSHHHEKLKQGITLGIFNHGHATCIHDSMHISYLPTQPDSSESSISGMMMTSKIITILICSCNLLTNIL